MIRRWEYDPVVDGCLEMTIDGEPLQTFLTVAGECVVSVDSNILYASAPTLSWTAASDNRPLYTVESCDAGGCSSDPVPGPLSVWLVLPAMLLGLLLGLLWQSWQDGRRIAEDVNV